MLGEEQCKKPDEKSTLWHMIQKKGGLGNHCSREWEGWYGKQSLFKLCL
jgi:hypothetical protein